MFYWLIYCLELEYYTEDKPSWLKVLYENTGIITSLKIYWVWGSQSGNYEDYRNTNLHLQMEDLAKQVTSTMKEVCMLHGLIYFSTLKMEEVVPSETSVTFYRTTRCHSPDACIIYKNKVLPVYSAHFLVRHLPVCEHCHSTLCNIGILKITY
jgi:hypothetical protein